MNNADKNSNGNKKPPILRVSDIIPPFHNDLIEDSKKLRPDKGLHNIQEREEQKNSNPENSEIPKFDVASQILTRQRQVSAMKRVSPAELKGSVIPEENKKHEPLCEEKQDKIAIKEIVKRDIDKFLQK